MEGLTAVSWGRDRIDLFWIGADWSLMHRFWNGMSWSADETLGGHLVAPPAVTAWGDNEMEVFVISPEGELLNRYWDGAAWHDWHTLGR